MSTTVPMAVPALTGARERARQFVAQLDAGATPDELGRLYEALPFCQQRAMADHVADLLQAGATTPQGDHVTVAGTGG